MGWNGILVEPLYEVAVKCLENRPSAIVENCALVSIACQTLLPGEPTATVEKPTRTPRDPTETPTPTPSDITSIFTIAAGLGSLKLAYT